MAIRHKEVVSDLKTPSRFARFNSTEAGRCIWRRKRKKSWIRRTTDFWIDSLSFHRNWHHAQIENLNKTQNENSKISQQTELGHRHDRCNYFHRHFSLIGKSRWRLTKWGLIVWRAKSKSLCIVKGRSSLLSSLFTQTKCWMTFLNQLKMMKTALKSRLNEVECLTILYQLVDWKVLS